MAENYPEGSYEDPNMKIRDIEEKQRILKERLLLTGKNLIEEKENNTKEFLNLKKDIEIIKRDVDRMKSFLETVSKEFSKFAKKEDLEMLQKQSKMFQPLDLVRKKDLERLKNN